MEVLIQLRKRTAAQKRISADKRRFKVGVWGRQSGKTTWGLDNRLEQALTGREGAIYWYLLQTYDAARVAFGRFHQMLQDAPSVMVKKNETEKFFLLDRRVKIFFKSGEVLENLRAETLDGATIDEFRQQHRFLWPRIIRPMLAKRKGPCEFLSTPNGFDHFYDLHESAILNPTEWGVHHAPSTEAPWWTTEEIQSVKSSMSEGEFAQEIMAEFRDITSGKAYICFGEWNYNRVSPFTRDGSIISPHLPIIVAMDFNISPMAWTLGQYASGRFYWFDEIWLEGSHTQEAAIELVERVKHHVPGVILAGDATSKASQRAAAGQSDYDIVTNILRLADVKFHNITPDSNPPVRDRINTMNARFRAADGTVNMWVHPERVPHLVRDGQRVVWKVGAQSTLDQTKDPTLTHSSDGVGYAVHALAPVTGSGGVGKLRVIKY